MARIGAWDFYDALPDDGMGRNDLNEVHRGVAAICDLRQEVGSGGFEAYFRYRGGDGAPDALLVIGTALGQAWADLLARAMCVVGPEYSTNATDRCNRLDKPGVGTQLDHLDLQFLELEGNDDADQLLTAYLALG